jgi:hypothetical protein
LIVSNERDAKLPKRVCPHVLEEPSDDSPKVR